MTCKWLKKQSPCCSPLKLQYTPFNYMSKGTLLMSEVFCIFSRNLGIGKGLGVHIQKKLRYGEYFGVIQIFLDSVYSVYYAGLNQRIFHLFQSALSSPRDDVECSTKRPALTFPFKPWQSSSTCVPCVHSEPPASAPVSRGDQSLSRTPTVHPPPSSCTLVT